MKYPVWPETPNSEIPSDISEIHLIRPIKTSRLLDLVSKKKIEKVFLSRSSLARLSKKAKKELEKNGVDIKVEPKRGRPLNIPMEKIREVVELHRDFQSFRKIEKLTGIPKSTIHYLVKYASRQKIRGENKIFYV